MKKFMVGQTLETISPYELDGPLEKTIERLQNIQKKYPDKHLKLDWRRGEYSDNYEYALIWERPENEQEVKKRQQEEVENKEYRRKLFEQLKKEFL